MPIDIVDLRSSSPIDWPESPPVVRRQVADFVLGRRPSPSLTVSCASPQSAKARGPSKRSDDDDNGLSPRDRRAQALREGLEERRRELAISGQARRARAIKDLFDTKDGDRAYVCVQDAKRVQPPNIQVKSHRGRDAKAVLWRGKHVNVQVEPRPGNPPTERPYADWTPQERRAEAIREGMKMWFGHGRPAPAAQPGVEMTQSNRPVRSGNTGVDSVQADEQLGSRILVPPTTPTPRQAAVQRDDSGTTEPILVDVPSSPWAVDLVHSDGPEHAGIDDLPPAKKPRKTPLEPDDNGPTEPVLVDVPSSPPAVDVAHTEGLEDAGIDVPPTPQLGYVTAKEVWQKQRRQQISTCVPCKATVKPKASPKGKKRTLPALNIRNRVVFSEEQQQVLKLAVDEERSIFFTGSAGEYQW